jgi:octopine/nopaline transport system substrate-binding protein
MKSLRLLALALAAATLATGGAAAQNKWAKITIATEGAYAPWNFVEAGKIVGFEIDLANDLCKRMKSECTIIAQDWDGIIPALNARKYDVIMAGMNITDKRLEVINFTRPYAAGPHGFAVMKGSALEKLAGAGQKFSMTTNPAESKKIIDEWRAALKGKTLGVQVSTTNSAFLEKYFKDVATIREYKTTEQHDLDLAAGRVDAIFAAHSAFVATMAQPQFKDMMIAGAGLSGDILGRGVAVGLRKADTDLHKMFDEAVLAACKDGTIKSLSMKWFKSDLSPQAC